MKASEIQQPGLYWALGCAPDPYHQVVRVFDSCGQLLMEWLGDDDPNTLEGFDCHDFIGPFPPPGVGEKFAGFKAALEALCRAYGVTLATSGYDGMNVWDAAPGRDEPLHCAGFEDHTKPVTG